MPENAQTEIEDALRLARAWDDSRREFEVRRNQLMAKGISLQLAGMIPPHTDPDWILEQLEASPLESLR